VTRFRSSAIACLLWLAVLPVALPLGARAGTLAAFICLAIGIGWDRRLTRRAQAAGGAAGTVVDSWSRRIEFTRDGKYFVGITVGVGLAAINTGNNLLYLVLGLLLSLIIASSVLSEMSLRNLKVERRPPPRLYAGRPFLMGIALTNAKKRLPSFSIEVEDLLGSEPIDKRCYFLKVPSGRTQHTSYRYSFARRGRYHYDGFRVATKFPFALFRKSRVVAAPGEVIVFPEITVVPTGLAPVAPGGASGAAGRIGRHGEFYGLRPLRADDDSRDIHWRASAKRGALLVREREEPASRRVLLVLDNGQEALSPANGNSAAGPPGFERLVSLTASLAVHYLDLGYLVGLVCRGSAIGPGHGPLHRVRLLTHLALVEPTPLPAPLPVAGEPPAERVMVNHLAQLADRLPPAAPAPWASGRLEVPAGLAALAELPGLAERPVAMPLSSPSITVDPSVLAAAAQPRPKKGEGG
jgi:uncharacterized protein (DUF58 family)